MDPQHDPSNVFTAMHHRVTGELLHLMDGLYSNIEDGLFELAFRARQEQQKRRCFDLMREMRFQRSRVVQNFARRLQTGFDAWIKGTDSGRDEAPSEQARRMAQKCTSHFSGVLQNLSERAAYALGRDVHRSHLPIGPHQIACHFIESMKALKFDDSAIEIVEELFSRFVLERLGSVYGECNQRLERAGFYTLSELDAASARAG
jgi:hypothetical protein